MTATEPDMNNYMTVSQLRAREEALMYHRSRERAREMEDARENYLRVEAEVPWSPEDELTEEIMEAFVSDSSESMRVRESVFMFEGDSVESVPADGINIQESDWMDEASFPAPEEDYNVKMDF